MAGSRKSPRSNTLIARVTAILRQHVKRGERLAAGLSGGVDSVVLLDLLLRASKKLRFELAALHVNHQINPAAGRWAAFCRALCRQRGVAFTSVRVKVPRGESLEAAARDARYRVFAALPADHVALAHNLDDQAETVLLQLLRGAGVKGLSAMPTVREQSAERRAHENRLTPAILRPLLEIPRSEIEAYARRRKLAWIEDESNADVYYDRNFLRHRVLPVLAERYPAYRRTLARASRNLAEAAQLLDDLGAADAQLTAGGLAISGLRGLSVPRAKNVIRYFIGLHGVTMPNAARLDESVRQLQSQRAMRTTIDLGEHLLRRHANELRIVAKTLSLPRSYRHEWHGENRLRLPELGGTLGLKKCRGSGISLARLAGAPVTVRVRQGGERLQLHSQRPRRSLKNLLQEFRIPPWERARLPLLFCGDELVWAAGIGVGCRFQAKPGETSVQPRWLLTAQAKR